jgi:ferredoxin
MFAFQPNAASARMLRALRYAQLGLLFAQRHTPRSMSIAALVVGCVRWFVRLERSISPRFRSTGTPSELPPNVICAWIAARGPACVEACPTHAIRLVVSREVIESARKASAQRYLEAIRIQKELQT